MKEIDFKIYQALNDSGSLSKSTVPKIVITSETFKNLVGSEILKFETIGRGVKISINKKDEFEKFFTITFPEKDSAKSKSGNIKKYRNSKAAKIDNSPIFLFRGFIPFEINGQVTDVSHYTHDFGLFAAVPYSITARKICFIENLETFLYAENLLGRDYIFVHKYGRIGKDSISAFIAEEILVFVDYDFNGLDEYLRIKSVFKTAGLYVPENYNELFDRYSVALRENKAKMSNAVRTSEDSQVVCIREQVARCNRFLEQEILINV